MGKTIGVVLSLKDKCSPQLSKIANKFGITEKEAQKLHNTIKYTTKEMQKNFREVQKAAKRLAILGAAISTVAIAAVKMASDFEQGMNNVSTLVDTNIESMDEMKKKILEIAKDSPKEISDLTDALYSIRSAGIDSSMAFDVLKKSEMLAVAGLATTAEAVDLSTSAINAFALRGEDANKIFDTFNKVVKYGKTNISEFAQGFGAVAGIVSSSHIELAEYSAAVSAMTTTGQKAAQAHTQLKAAIAGLTRGSKEQVALFNKLGAKSFEDLIQKSGGMVNAFNAIYKATGGNKAQLVKLMGSVEAFNAVLSLSGGDVKNTYLKALDDMKNGGDSLTEAYGKQMDGLNNQMAAMKNKFQIIGIKIGTALMPVVKDLMPAIEEFVNFFVKHTNLVIAVGSALVATFVAFNVINGVIKTIATLQKVIQLVTVAQGIWNAVMMNNPIGAIAVGIGLLIGLIVLLVRNWDKVVEVVKKAIDAVKQFIGLKLGKKTVEIETKNTTAKDEKPKKHALGISYSTGGPAIVGEYGPEIVNLKKGDTVTTAPKTQQILKNNNQKIEINVNIAGNLIGNGEFINHLKNTLALELKTALVTV